MKKLAVFWLFVCFFSLDALKIDKNVSTDTSANTIGMRTVFANPCYKESVTPEMITVDNGAVINFASSGIIGSTIRSACKNNDVENPYGITHCGLIINANPEEIYKLVQDIDIYSYDGSILTMLIRQKQNALNDIYNILEEKSPYPFIVEADGSVEEVLRGIYPHVHIRAFPTRVEQYSGNIYIRNLKEGVVTELNKTKQMDFLHAVLFKSYEVPKTTIEMVKAINKKNEIEQLENVYCSELVAYFYKYINALDKTLNSSNMIPEYLSSGAGEKDIFKDILEKDILIKDDFVLESQERKYSIWECVVQTFLSCYCGLSANDEA